MKRLILAFALAASIVTAAPVVLPEQATQAAADTIVIGTKVYRKVFPYVIEWTYYPGGWVMTNAWYDMSIGF